MARHRLFADASQGVKSRFSAQLVLISEGVCLCVCYCQTGVRVQASTGWEGWWHFVTVPCRCPGRDDLSHTHSKSPTSPQEEGWGQVPAGAGESPLPALSVLSSSLSPQGCNSRFLAPLRGGYWGAHSLRGSKVQRALCWACPEGGAADCSCWEELTAHTFPDVC